MQLGCDSYEPEYINAKPANELGLIKSWFGTRGLEVQILSPRPTISNDLKHLCHSRRQLRPYPFPDCAQFCAHLAARRPQGRCLRMDEHTSRRFPRSCAQQSEPVSTRRIRTHPTASGMCDVGCKVQMAALERCARLSDFYGHSQAKTAELAD